MVEGILSWAIIYLVGFLIMQTIEYIGEHFSKKWDFGDTMNFFGISLLTITIIYYAINEIEPSLIFGFHCMNFLTVLWFFGVIFNWDKGGFLLSIGCSIVTLFVLFFLSDVILMIQPSAGNIIESYWVSVFFIVSSVIVRILVEKYKSVLRGSLPDFVTKGMMIMQ